MEADGLLPLLLGVLDRDHVLADEAAQELATGDAEALEVAHQNTLSTGRGASEAASPGAPTPSGAP